MDGVDASAFAAYYARSRFDLEVVCGTIDDAGFTAASFDLVIQKDLLEHVSDPRSHLVETARIMKPGAELWLPGQRRFARHVTREPERSADEPDTTKYESLARLVDQDVASHHRWIRGWAPYFQLHRLSKRLDALPARTGAGYDFEFWLRRREGARLRLACGRCKNAGICRVRNGFVGASLLPVPWPSLRWASSQEWRKGPH